MRNSIDFQFQSLHNAQKESRAAKSYEKCGLAVAAVVGKEMRNGLSRICIQGGSR